MIEIRDLHVRFHGASREAVAGIDLAIHDGEIVGLVGESGSGKTVTAMTLSGLIERKKVALSGEVLLDGRDILCLPRAELRAIQGSEIGVVFQEPMTAMDPLMRIGAQVEEALTVHTQLTRAERRARALEALRDVDLPDPEEIYRKYPHECSGGQLQRVMIAAAIVWRCCAGSTASAAFPCCSSRTIYRWCAASARAWRSCSAGILWRRASPSGCSPRPAIPTRWSSSMPFRASASRSA